MTPRDRVARAAGVEPVDLDPDRARRAAAALSEGRVRIVPQEEPGTYLVSSFGDFDPNGFYAVHLNRQSCTCPDSLYRGTDACKHLLAVVLVEGLT